MGCHKSDQIIFGVKLFLHLWYERQCRGSDRWSHGHDCDTGTISKSCQTLLQGHREEAIHSFTLILCGECRTVITPEHSLMSTYPSAATPWERERQRDRHRERGRAWRVKPALCILPASHVLLLIKPLYMFFESCCFFANPKRNLQHFPNGKHLLD